MTVSKSDDEALPCSVLQEVCGSVPGAMVGGPAVAVGLLRPHYLLLAPLYISDVF